MPSALIVGSASCVWDDLAAAAELFEPDAVFVVNDMIPRYEGVIDYTVTLHPEKLFGWQLDRLTNGYNNNYCSVSFERAETREKGVVYPCIDKVVDWRYADQASSGSSGLYAVKVAQEEGFDRILLAGVPMTQTPHFDRRKDWQECETFLATWVKVKHRLGTVRSMSGFTRELLGYPTSSWLAGGEH